jgi:hypothetical protein
MKEKAAFGRPPSFPTREASVVGHLRDVGDGTFGGAMGVQRCLGSGGGASVGRRRQRIVVGGAAAPSDARAAALEPCI